MCVCIYIYIYVCVCMSKNVYVHVYMSQIPPSPRKKKNEKKRNNQLVFGNLWEVFPGSKKNFSPMLTGFPHEPSQARLMHRVSSVPPIGNTETPGLLDTDCRSHGKPYQPCKQLGKPSDWGDQRTQLGHSNGLGQLGKIEGRSCWMLLPVRNIYICMRVKI